MKTILGVVTASVLALSGCSSAPQPIEQNAGSGDGAPVSAAQDRARGDCRAEASKSFAGKDKSVRLRISPCRITAGQTPKVVLTNTGNGELGYGPGFKLERRVGARWRWVNRRQAFPLPLFYLAPGERSDPESLAVYFDKPQRVELRPGLYRVTKSVDLTPGNPRPPTMAVKATFTID